jgi:hypothetical protein
MEIYQAEYPEAACILLYAHEKFPLPVRRRGRNVICC